MEFKWTVAKCFKDGLPSECGVRVSLNRVDYCLIETACVVETYGNRNNANASAEKDC